jgi:hypothetical protein
MCFAFPLSAAALGGPIVPPFRSLPGIVCIGVAA